jgi:hypothetical protein
VPKRGIMASMDNTNTVGQPGSKRWLGSGVRLLVTLFFLSVLVALNRCSLPGQPALQPTVDTPAPQWPKTTLRVVVRPLGAAVLVDGLRSGTTPVSLALPEGQHTVRVELEGYEPLNQTVELFSEEETIVSGELVPALESAPLTVTVAPVPYQEDHSPLPDLAIRTVKIELQTGGACDYISANLGASVIVENRGNADAGPFVVEVNGIQQPVGTGLAAGQSIGLWVEGYNQSGETRVVVDPVSQVEESNKENNVWAQRVPIPTLPPTCTPPPSAVLTVMPAAPIVDPCLWRCVWCLG